MGEYGEVLILRKKTADGAFELYSDLDSKIMALEKRRSHYRSGMLGALVLVLNRHILRLVFGNVEPDVMQAAETYF